MLNAFTKYSSNIFLLVGDGTHVTIERVSKSMFSTRNKLLHLFNVLHVPKIRKNLLSVS